MQKVVSTWRECLSQVGLLELPSQGSVEQDSVNDNDGDQNSSAKRYADVSKLQGLDNILSAKRARSLSDQTAGELAATVASLERAGTAKDQAVEVVLNEHAESVGLVVDPVRPVVPEPGQVDTSNKVALDAHPESVEERADSERGYKDR